VPFEAVPLAHNVVDEKQSLPSRKLGGRPVFNGSLASSLTNGRLYAMDGPGLHIDTKKLVEAADGFLAASSDTRAHAQSMEEELRPYANDPERFQGPVADEFRRLYREIADDLERIKKEASDMSALVEQAKLEFSKRAVSAAGQLPTSRTGGGSVFNALSPR
jgi:hypothetical protein